MADKFWISADGDYDIGFTGGVTLVSADRGIFPASNTQAVLSNHDDHNAVDAALIWFQEGFNANIGSGGSELFTSAGIVRYEGGGQLFLKAGDNRINLTIIRARAASAGITSVTLIGTGTTDYEDIIVQRGNVSLGGSMADIASLTIMRDSIVSLASGTTAVLLEMTGGTFNSNGAITTADICGGVLNQDTAVIGTELRMKAGTVNLLFGGTYPLINQYGGHIDLTRSSDVKIITEWNIYGGTYAINELTTATINDYR